MCGFLNLTFQRSVAALYRNELVHMMEFIHFSGAPNVIVKSLPFSLSGATIEDRSVDPAGRQHRKVEPWNNRSFFGARRNAELRSEEHTSELQSLMRISYAVFCLKKKNKT